MLSSLGEMKISMARRKAGSARVLDHKSSSSGLATALRAEDLLLGGGEFLVREDARVV